MNDKIYTIIENQSFPMERAFYNASNIILNKCSFEGEEDGESALKETRNIKVNDCDFRLRYPFWHVIEGEMTNTRLYDTCRAALWYVDTFSIDKSVLGGIKALRECKNIKIVESEINSDEFGWMNDNVSIYNSSVASSYPFFHTNNLVIDTVNLKGKYSFQYTENVTIINSVLDTKDAFWHSKNVTVKDSVIKGEYLAWYSENLTLINCKISGTQPLCYCNGLKIIDCEMEGADFAFEYSECDVKVTTPLISVKNPLSGTIVAPKIGEIILDQQVYKCDASIIETGMK